MIISTVGGEVVFGLGTATQMNLEKEMWGCIMSTLVHVLLAYYPYLHVLLVAFCSCNNNMCMHGPFQVLIPQYFAWR